MKRVALGSSPEGPGDGSVHLAAVESTVFAKLHNLVSHCSVVRYEDGSPRQPGWFTVKTMGAAWVVQLKDPDACAQLSAVGQSLDDALCLADLLLGSEKAPWEADPFLKGRKSKMNK